MAINQPPDAMGLGLYFNEGEGPRFHKPVRRAQDIAALPVPDPEKELRYVMDAIRLCRQELHQKVPLIGFAGSPWTLATYMVEGGASKEFQLIKSMLYQQPALLHQLLNTLAESVEGYLNAQISAGAQAIMLFDTWGGILTTQHYRDFSLNYMQKIIRGLKRTQDNQPIPIVLFTKGGAPWLEMMAAVGCDALGVDWTIDIGVARRRVGGQVALQGNLDPAALYGAPEDIRQGVAAVLNSYGKGAGHVFNLGHGISRHVAPENVKVLVDSVHELSASISA